MTDLTTIINALSTKEQHKFVAYLEDKNKRKDTKNVLLFKLIAKSELDSKSICTQLYKVEQCNAYHALRKRLFQSLIDFTANKNLEDENSTDMQIIKYILASRTYLLQNNFEIAYKILDKAERIAEEHSLYPILNEIYHTKIQYAPNYSKVNLKDLIKKQTENHKKHLLEDQLNIVYAKLKSVLNQINYEGKIINFEEELNTILKELDITLNESLSFKSLYQILAIANISALVTSKYYEIEEFVLKSYQILKNKKDSEKQLFYQIHIVYIIANTLFRNKRFNESLRYIREMKLLMESKNGTYKNTFILKSTLVEALNYNYTNHQGKAINLVESIIKKKHKDIESLLDLHLSLLMFYFQNEEFTKAKSILSKFYHTDNYYIEKASIDWVIKKNIAEILLYIELTEDDHLFSRLNSFKSKYTSYLKQIGQNRILLFISFAERIYNNPVIVNNPEFKKQIATSFDFSNPEKEDIFVLSSYAWLKSKITKTNLYETTIKTIKQSTFYP